MNKYKRLSKQFLDKYHCHLCDKCIVDVRDVRKGKIDFEQLTNPYCKCTADVHVHIKSRKICKMDIPKTPDEFSVLLHEIGHCEHPKGIGGWFSQFYASLWAAEELQKLSLPIPETMKDVYISIQDMLRFKELAQIN